MKRDIRDLFKEDEELKTLPKYHKKVFLEKLHKQPNKATPTFFWLKITAVAIIAITVGFSVFYKSAQVEEQSPMLAQIEAVEAKYLEDIKVEWERFVAIANDEVLVSRFKRKLDDLSNDYQELSLQFKADSNNILVIEALIDNLQNRLQLLKNIQEHITILNQNNEQHETII